MLVQKAFFKLYQQVMEKPILIGIAAVPTFPQEEFLEYMDVFNEDGYSFIPTTYEAYIEYKEYQDLGNIDQYEDLQTQNIRC